MQRILAAVLVIAGLALAGWVVLDDTGDDIGSVSIGSSEETPAATSSPTPATTPSPVEPEPATTSESASPKPELPDVRPTSVSLEDLSFDAPVPTRVRVPSIGVDTTVLPVGPDETGSMQAPDDVSLVGWYRYGRAPASPKGTTVLGGHVDSRTQGRGAFFELRAVEVGDEVVVTDEEGTETTWRVTGRRTYLKDEAPYRDIFKWSGDRRLILITCGGDFDAAARSYQSNIVVEAEPVP